MTSYIVHYNDSGGPETIGPLSASLTSYDITGLSRGLTHISVEATSQHLSGESVMTIRLRTFKSQSQVLYIVHV